MKTGRLSKAEWDFIERNADLMPPEQIAKELDRELDPVKNYLIKIGKSLHKKQDLEDHIEYELTTRPYWKELEAQFTNEELELFGHLWARVIAQFKKDVLYTEELQIIDMLKLEILMNRVLKEQKQLIDSSEYLTKELIKLRKLKVTDPREQVEHKDRLFDLEKQIAILRQDKESLLKEYRDLSDKKDRSWKLNKATRDQRFDNIESNRQTFSSLAGRIAKDSEFRNSCSLQMEKFRLAIEKEKERLGSYHQFGSETDLCLLNEETIAKVQE